MSLETIDVNTIITRALNVIRAESYYQQENQDARQYVIDTLNDILSTINLDADMVPFNKVFDFNITPAASEYIVGTSVDSTVVMPQTPASLVYINLEDNGFTYPITMVDNFTQLNSVLPKNIGGRPWQVRINAEKNAFRLNFYPVPDTTYLISMLYRQVVPYVTWQGTIDLPIGFRSYVMYELARRVNLEKNMQMWTQQHEAEYINLRNKLQAYIETDYRVRSVPPMLHYGQYYLTNLGVVR